MLELLRDCHLDLARSDARHGFGLFETLRVEKGCALRLERHLDRLSRGAAWLGLDQPPPAEEVRRFLQQHTTCADLSLGVLRLWAVDGKLLMAEAPWEPARPEWIRIGLSTGTVRFSRSPACRFKTLAYLENRVLARETEARGLFETIAVNEVGRLTDGWRTNLFLVKGGELLTPFTQDGALPGVARSLLLEMGWVREASLGPEDLQTAEGAILSNALQGVIPVHEACGRPLNAAHPSITRALEAYSALTG